MILVLLVVFILQMLGVPEAAQLWQWFMENWLITLILVLVFL